MSLSPQVINYFITIFSFKCGVAQGRIKKFSYVSVAASPGGGGGAVVTLPLGCIAA